MLDHQDAEIDALAVQMARQNHYENAWTLGLEIQSFGEERISAFKSVLEKGTLAARRATAFWLSDEAEHIPAEMFLQISDDSDDDIRFYAAYGLGYAHHPQAVPKLRKMLLHDSSSEVRQTAAHSLYSAALINGKIEDIIGDFGIALEKETSPIVREEIVTSLSYFLGTTALDKAIGLLEKAARDGVPEVAEQAQISLSVLRNESLFKI
jgi:HEAT repeat protein